MNTTRKLTISALIMALYIALLYVTAGVSFGAYQVRIATAFYAMSYIFPFLVIPMGLANFIANAFGGLGLVDMVGGLLVGMITTGLIVLIRKFNISSWAIILPIILVPGLCVPLWLSYLLGLPYEALVINVMIGQITPAIVGTVLVRALEPKLKSLLSL